MRTSVGTDGVGKTLAQKEQMKQTHIGYEAYAGLMRRICTLRSHLFGMSGVLRSRWRAHGERAGRGPTTPL